ncbi:MAG: hypothetical protein DWQ08_01180, partial [Proteobacteria bacterium]
DQTGSGDPVWRVTFSANGTQSHSILFEATSEGVAISESPGADPVSEVQEINPGDTDGIKLRFNGVVSHATGGFDVTDDASTVQGVLNGMASITAAGGVTVAKPGTNWIVTFNNPGNQSTIDVVGPGSVIDIETQFDPDSPANDTKSGTTGTTWTDFQPSNIEVVGEAIYGENGQLLDVIGIENITGKVRLNSAAGDILVQANIIAAEIDINSGRNFVLNIPDVDQDGTPDPIFHTAGTPVSAFGGVRSVVEPYEQAVDVQTNGVEDPATYPFDLTGPVDSALSASAYGNGIFAANRVSIAAPVINVNGLIQSGEPDWSLTIGNIDTAVSLLESTYGVVGGTYEVVSGAISGNIDVYYNVTENRLELNGIRNQGGRIDLFGDVISTGNGKLEVYDGFAHIDIDNNSNYDIVTNRLEVGNERINGTIKIVDSNFTTGGQPRVTEYYRDASGVMKKDVYALPTPGNNPAPVTSDASGGTPGRSAAYSPKSDLVYVFQTGQTGSNIVDVTYAQSGWLGIDAFARDPDDVTSYSERIADSDGDGVPDLVPLLSGEFILVDGSMDDKYQYSFIEQNTGSSVVTFRDDWSTTDGWGTKTSYLREITETPFKKIHTHELQADRAIDIEFIGFDSGDVDIDSKHSVLINANIQNSSGDTSIASTLGEIIALNNGAVINGENISLQAATGIHGSFIQTNLTDGGSGALTAVTTTGDIEIKETSGELRVDTVSTAGNVSLEALTNIVGADGSDSGGAIGGVSANFITLNAIGGTIGTDISPFEIDTGNELVSGLIANAAGVVNLYETDGDLNLEQIRTGNTFDVFLMVDGNLNDANEFSNRDDRTEAQLLELFDRMRSTGTQADISIVENIAGYENTRTGEYHDYWNLKRTQDHDPLDFIRFEDIGQGAQYYAIVSGDIIRFAATPADATSGTAVDIDASNATGSEHGVAIGGGINFDTLNDVDGSSNTITLTGHTYANGDAVAYAAGSNPPVGGLPEFTTLYVGNVNGDEVQLFSDAAQSVVVSLTATTDSKSGNIRRVVLFEPATDVTDATDVIDLGAGHGLATGDEVYYVHGAADAAVETRIDESLVDGETYYVVVDSTGAGSQTVRLAKTNADAVAGSPVVIDIENAGASGAQHQLFYGDATDGLFDPSADVANVADTIAVTGTGLATGDAVVYHALVYDPTHTVQLNASETTAYTALFGDAYDESESVPIDGSTTVSTDGLTRSEFIDAGIDAIENKRTAEYHALHDTYGDIGNASGDPAVHDVNAYDVDFEYVATFGLTKTFDGADISGNVIDFGVKGLQTGSEVIFNEGDAAIAGLTDGDTYFVVLEKTAEDLVESGEYVVIVDEGNPELVRLAVSANAAAEGMFLDLDDTNATGAGHSLTRVSDSLSAGFSITAGDVDNAGDAIDLGAGHGLATGDVVTYSAGGGDAVEVLEEDPTRFTLVDDATDVGNPSETIALTGAGAGHGFTLIGNLHAEFDPASDIEGDNQTINVGPNVFKDGQALVYRSGGGVTVGIDGSGSLADTKANGDLITYYAVVDDTDPGKIRLAADPQDLNGSIVTLDTSSATGTRHYLSDGDSFTIGSKWTVAKLTNSIGAGVLKPTGDTQVDIETGQGANIIGRNVVVTTGLDGAGTGGVGNVGDDVVVNLPLAGGLTTDQKLALSSAERDDIIYYDGLNGTGNVLDPGGDLSSAQSMVINVKDDVDVDAAGMITITADAHIFLGSEIDINLDQVDADSEIRIKGATGIFDAIDRNLSANTPNVVGGNTILEGGEDHIGTAAKPILTNLYDDATLIARAGFSGGQPVDIHITEIAGNINVDTIFASGTVYV